MELDQLDISDEGRFESYLTKIRQPDYPYDKFVAMVIHLPRRLAQHHLRKATYHANMAVVCEAIDLLARLFPAESETRCLELLNSCDSFIRACAIRCLILIESKQEEAILDLLASEPESEVRFACIEYLARAGTSRALPVLQTICDYDKSVDYEDRPIGRAADAAMRRIQQSANDSGSALD